MNVDVHTVAEAFEVPIMTKLDRATLTASQVWGERNPSYYIIEGKGNAVAQAVNRLRAAGLTPSWTLAPIDAQGHGYAAGSLVVPATKVSRPLVDRFARELGLRSIGLKGKAPANVAPLVARASACTSRGREHRRRLGLCRTLRIPFTNVTDSRSAPATCAQFDAGAPARRPNDSSMPAPGALRRASADWQSGVRPQGLRERQARWSGSRLVVRTGARAAGLPSWARAPENSRLFCPGSLVRLSLDRRTRSASACRPTRRPCSYGSAYELAREPGGGPAPALA
jgi:hypothetical protein